MSLEALVAKMPPIKKSRSVRLLDQYLFPGFTALPPSGALFLVIGHVDSQMYINAHKCTSAKRKSSTLWNKGGRKDRKFWSSKTPGHITATRVHHL